ncbi:MAG: cyclic nucleotide-binding domain-containing protein [Gaiellales bacterium]
MQLFSHDTKADALGLCPFFAGLSRKELGELAKRTEDLEVEAGKALAREGEPGSEFFVIVEGEVSVTKDGQEIRTLGPGDFFGEIALIEDRPRTATVTAKTPLRFFVLTRQNFRSLLQQQPELEEKVIRALEERVRATEQV